MDVEVESGTLDADRVRVLLSVWVQFERALLVALRANYLLSFFGAHSAAGNCGIASNTVDVVAVLE